MLSNVAERNVSYAVQYLIAGRFAVEASLIPVAGNLLHHAVEMAMKAGLENAGVAVPRSHDLTALWALFQSTFKPIAGFDQAIEDLQKFEDIRYPDRIAATLLISVGYKREAHPHITHQVALDEIDALYEAIFSAARINWRVFIRHRQTLEPFIPPARKP